MVWPVKIKKGHILSPIDLSSYERYLKKFPRDHAIRFEYARYLEQKGSWAEALEQYEQASRQGHLESTIRLKQFNLDHGSDVSASIQRDLKRRRRSRRSRRTLFVLLTLLLSLLIILPLLPTFVQLPDVLDPPAVASHPVTQPTTPEELPLLAMKNAAARYQEAKGKLPDNFSDLTGPAPENWLSPIDPDPTRSCPCLIGQPLFELHYYRETNQLALVRDKEILALYPVASGPVLPFEQAKVTKRVVNPNGGQGVYGTRGLVLQDNYAIHGTNRPELIGQHGITKGCLRMRNEDLEILYSYVSIGTPFAVKSGTPAPPTFAGGLPALKRGASSMKSEETPNVSYSWKY